MYTALALLIVVGISFLMTLVGLSPALGAFLAGVVLANSRIPPRVGKRYRPVQGAAAGAVLYHRRRRHQFERCSARTVTMIGLALLVIVAQGLDPLSAGPRLWLSGARDWLFTLGLAQAGEFGFVLMSFSVQQNVVPRACRKRCCW